MKDPAITALEALGHIRVPNERCTARYKETENPGSGPRNPPVWCDLKAGHDGPHRHVTGHHSAIMSRENLIEMKPLPDVCQKCGTKWPCRDAEAVIAAFAIPVPQTLPPMDAEMAWILGRPNFTLIGYAKRLRELGHEINTRSEDEQASVIYWMLNLYLQHGATWRDEGEKILKA